MLLAFSDLRGIYALFVHRAGGIRHDSELAALIRCVSGGDSSEDGSGKEEQGSGRSDELHLLFGGIGETKKSDGPAVVRIEFSGNAGTRAQPRG